jgi:hypothetical protein
MSRKLFFTILSLVGLALGVAAPLGYILSDVDSYWRDNESWLPDRPQWGTAPEVDEDVR